MRKVSELKILLALICFVLPISVLAQHYVTPSIQAGYQRVFDDMEQTTFKGWFGTQLGANYQWQHEHLLLSAGVEASYALQGANIADYSFKQRMLDTENMPFTYDVDVTARKDRYQQVSLRVPVLAGGEWDKFYFLAGVVPDISLWGNAQMNATMTTAGDYAHFYSPLTSMPNHGFFTQTVQSKQKVLYNVDILAHVEAGVSLGEEERKYRIALFGEIGALNLAPASSAEHLASPYFDTYIGLNLNHPYIAREGISASAHKYEVGVKFSVAFKVADNKDAKPKRRGRYGYRQPVKKNQPKKAEPKAETKQPKAATKPTVIHMQTVIVVHQETDIVNDKTTTTTTTTTTNVE